MKNREIINLLMVLPLLSLVYLCVGFKGSYKLSKKEFCETETIDVFKNKVVSFGKLINNEWEAKVSKEISANKKTLRSTIVEGKKLYDLDYFLEDIFQEEMDSVFNTFLDDPNILDFTLSVSVNNTLGGIGKQRYLGIRHSIKEVSIYQDSLLGETSSFKHAIGYLTTELDKSINFKCHQMIFRYKLPSGSEIDGFITISCETNYSFFSYLKTPQSTLPKVTLDSL